MKTLLFSDFVEINPRIKLNAGEEYPFVEMALVEPGRRYVRANRHRVYKNGGAKFLPSDILFARITPCLENGKIAQYIDNSGTAAFGSTEFFVFRARPEISNAGFIFYLANSELIRKPAEKSMSGTSGRQRADLASIVNIEVPFIPLLIQHKIASILSAYDDLIENNLRRIQILEEMAQNLYREWFVKFRFPGHEKVKFVDSPLGKIPEGWKVTKLGQLCTKLQSGGTPSRKKAEYWQNGNIAWYKTKELNDGFLSEPEERISIEGLQGSSAKLFEPGTILMAIYGATIGYLGILTMKAACNQAALGFVANASKASQQYIFFTLLELRPYLISIAQGAAQQNISKVVVSNTNCIHPPMDILNQFTSYIYPIWSLLRNLQSKNVTLRQTRDLLLPKLISGELDVSELDIEVPEDTA